MSLSLNAKKRLLLGLGAEAEDIQPLLDYTNNVFSYNPNKDEMFLIKWYPLLAQAKEVGTANAINEHLLSKDSQVPFESPEEIEIEIYDSFAGKIPIITTASDADFEQLSLKRIYKDKDYPHIKKQGASFASGKVIRFMILSKKPYSNVPGEAIGMDDIAWRDKSLVIRKHHEYTHYYTKQFFGSSRNNLHDELVADFAGLWAAFGEYKAEYFMQFLNQGRLQIYVEGLSPSAAIVVERLARLASAWVEAWTKTNEFLQLTEVERINFLCNKELLEYGG